MDRSFDLCAGRDYRGRLFYTKVPRGVVRTGMFVRLVGGVFLIIERVECGGRVPGGMGLCAAAQVLESVWEGRGNG